MFKINSLKMTNLNAFEKNKQTLQLDIVPYIVLALNTEKL